MKTKNPSLDRQTANQFRRGCLFRLGLRNQILASKQRYNSADVTNLDLAYTRLNLTPPMRQTFRPSKKVLSETATMADGNVSTNQATVVSNTPHVSADIKKIVASPTETIAKIIKI